jgi:hypothetical protein
MVLPLIADSAMPTEIDYQQRIAAYDRRQVAQQCCKHVACAKLKELGDCLYSLSYLHAVPICSQPTSNNKSHSYP